MVQAFTLAVALIWSCTTQIAQSLHVTSYAYIGRLRTQHTHRTLSRLYLGPPNPKARDGGAGRRKKDDAEDNVPDLAVLATEERLQKVISRAGIASRRAAETLVRIRCRVSILQ
jgi:hypothetical protein